MNCQKKTLLFFMCMLMQSCKPMATPNFQQMTVPLLPNHCLACPSQFCNIPPDIISPVYPVSAENLFNLFNQVIAKNTYANFTYSMPEQGQFGLMVRSVILGLPDDVAIQFIALSDNTSSLAIYSQSRYLYYDFGLNRKRINSWFQALASKMEK